MEQLIKDVLGPGETDTIAMVYWSGQGITLDIPYLASGRTGDEVEKILEHGWKGEMEFHY